MPAPGRCTLAGVPFAFPDYADGVDNCVRLRGKMIDLPDVPANVIYFLGSALISRHTTAPATLYYADGESERQLVMLGGDEHGNVEVLKTAVMHVQNRIRDSGGWPMYVAAIYPRRDEPIDCIRFDDVFHGVQAFAVTVSNHPPPDELAGKLAPFGIASIEWGHGLRGARVLMTCATCGHSRTISPAPRPPVARKSRPWAVRWKHGSTAFPSTASPGSPPRVRCRLTTSTRCGRR